MQDVQKLPLEERLEQPLAELGLSVRTVNAMERSGVFTVGELVGCCGASTEQCLQYCVCRELHDKQQETARAKRVFKPPLRLLSIGNVGRATVREMAECIRKFLS